jgi:hypothetical protein
MTPKFTQRNSAATAMKIPVSNSKPKKGKGEELVLKTKKAEVISTTPQKVELAKDSCVGKRPKVCTGGTAGYSENYLFKVARQEMGAKKTYDIFKQVNN